MTIVEFLNARLDEDEERARWPSKRTVYVGQTRADVRELAEVEAKRRIVENYSVPTIDDMETPARYYPTSEHTLRALTLPYADHPDYDEEWRP